MTEFEKRQLELQNLEDDERLLEEQLYQTKQTIKFTRKRLRELCPHTETGRGIYGDEICNVCGKNLT